MHFARVARAATTFALTVAALACADSPSPTAPSGPQYISNGTPTGSAYGGVGVLLIDVEGDGLLNGSIGICSGSLIAETVFLTAGHCVDFGPDAVYYVSFAPDAFPFTGLIQATATYASSTDDVAVVILPEGSTTGLPTYSLPTAGFLDQLKKGGGLARETAVVVGYGNATLHRGPAESDLDLVRRVATTKLLSLQGPYALIADAHGNATGGTCSGDSGGPVFLEGQDPDLIVAITTAGFPAGCHAIGIYTRLDTESILTFLNQYL